MADTIRERIIKNIKTTLEGITVANGYANTIVRVERVRQSGQITKDTPYLVISTGDESPHEKQEDPTLRKLLTVYILIGTRQDEGVDPKWADELINSLLGDIQKAMASTHTRGGLALDTIEGSNGPMPIEDGMTTLETFQEYTIDYRHARTDPTALI